MERALNSTNGFIKYIGTLTPLHAMFNPRGSMLIQDAQECWPSKDVVLATLSKSKITYGTFLGTPIADFMPNIGN